MTTASDVVCVAIVGGSIAGCAAAMAAHRAGCEVAVYERSSCDLAERGFGIVLSSEVREELTTAGYLSPSAPALPIKQRLWVTRETGGDGWRELWRQPMAAVACNWGLLWQSLRANVPDTTYRSAHSVTGVGRAEDGHAVVSIDGRGDLDYDLVIGADGYRSIVRDLVAPGSASRYAGYVALRGCMPLGDLPDDFPVAELLADAGLTAVYDGGHMVGYLIPDGVGGRRVNWVLYAYPPQDLEVDPQHGSFAPGAVVDELISWGRKLADERLPSQIAQMIACTPEEATGLQPIFDLTLGSSVRMPFLLTGDASSITRPHTASGAIKALQDALCLERALRSSPSVEEAAAVFDGERNPAGNHLVELSRRIGHDQVEATPDWSTMDAESMSKFVEATFSGQDHYLFSNER